MLNIFNFLLSTCNTVFIAFCEYLMPSPVKKVAQFQCLSYQHAYIYIRAVKFLRLLNPDWSIQISVVTVQLYPGWSPTYRPVYF